MEMFSDVVLKVDEESQEQVLEELRTRLVSQYGVTLNGPYLTLRWGGTRTVTLLAISVDSGVRVKGVHRCEGGGVCEYHELDEMRDHCFGCGLPHERK